MRDAIKDHNDSILARMRGVAPSEGTPETDADPRNPNANALMLRVALAIATHRDGGRITPGSSLLTRETVAEWHDLANTVIKIVRADLQHSAVNK